ncbi:MAG: hypothetical protein ACLRFG_01975 [Clostridia bacterium]
MYTDKNGNVWSSEENYIRNNCNVRYNYCSALALEDYADFNNKYEIFNDEAFVSYEQYVKTYKSLTEKELLELTTTISKKFDELFDKIGRDKFIFYDDGDVEYIWDWSKIKR